MQARCPECQPIGPVRLAHYTLAFTRYSRVWNSGTADILPLENAAIWGVLYDFTLQDLVRMDRIANYPHAYTRQDVHVQKGEQTLPALTYVAVRIGVYAPSSIYLEKMVRSAEHWKMDTAYIASLKAILAMPDR